MGSGAAFAMMRVHFSLCKSWLSRIRVYGPYVLQAKVARMNLLPRESQDNDAVSEGVG